MKTDCFWFPILLLAAALLCCLIAYARYERQAEEQWDKVCAEIERQAREGK